MRASLATLRVLVELALRNMLASRGKTLLVSGIVGFAALLLVVGFSLLQAVDRAMQRSITGSVTGHIQVYSSASEDELELLRALGNDAPNIAPLRDFAAVKRALLSVPNVAAALPMGFHSAVVSTGNALDTLLAQLRATDASDPARSAEALKARLRQNVELLRQEVESAAQLGDRSVAPEELSALERASGAEFWADFEQQPDAQLEFLENFVAPLAGDGEDLLLAYVGTDPEAFGAAFDRMQIVDGQAIPKGERGLLLSKYVYEAQLKLKAARGLDELAQAVELRGRTIARDPELQRLVRENVASVHELMLQLDPIQLARYREKLQRFLGSEERDVAMLLARFFDTDDRSLRERHRFFYAQLAPALDLYRVRIGDTLAVKGFTQSGYTQSANLKVYGTFSFRGLESSPQAGAISMLDLVSFRDLYGFASEEREREQAALRAASGARELSREDAEAELFGTASQVDPDPLESETTEDARAGDPLDALRGTRERHQRRVRQGYAAAQLEQGAVLSVAVIVRDEQAIDETRAAIEAAGRAAGLPLKAISWQQAVGLLGQFTTLVRMVLLAAVSIIFLVALWVINNALMLAAIQRVREIGTLRAVGAQRQFILGMLLLEATVIGLVSGACGTLLGALALQQLARIGIPAVEDVLKFFFSGPRLYPRVEWPLLLFAMLCACSVSIVSSLYPAWLAMRVSPRQAMQTED